MKCGKCGYVRQANESVSESECPSCGIVYAKYHQAQRSPSFESSFRETNVAIERASNVNWVRLLTLAFLCLVIGYYAGREHLKYQVRSTLAAAADDLRQGTAGDTEKSISPTTTVPIDPPPTNTLVRRQGAAPQVPVVQTPVQNPVPRQDAAECLKIVSMDSSKLSTNSVYTEMAWKVDVSNKCDIAFQVRVTFMFADKDDFELDVGRADIYVGPNQTAMARDRMLVSPPEKARRIEKHGARLSVR